MANMEPKIANIGATPKTFPTVNFMSAVKRKRTVAFNTLLHTFVNYGAIHEFIWKYYVLVLG